MDKRTDRNVPFNSATETLRQRVLRLSVAPPCAEDSHFHLGQSYVLPGNFHYLDAGGRPLHADLRIRRVHGLLLQS